MTILILGANGQVGHALTKQQAQPVIALTRTQLDLTQPQQIAKIFQQHQPTLVINAAAYTAVDKAEQEPFLAMQVNALGPEFLARTCHSHNIPLIHFSTDYVFDGRIDRPYTETDPTNPLNIYGLSKWFGEEAVRRHCRQHIILRLSGVYGEFGHNFPKTILKHAQERETLSIVNDQLSCPTPVTEIATTVWKLIDKVHQIHEALWGTYHYCGNQALTWYDFAKQIIDDAATTQSLSVKEIIPTTSAAFGAPAKRPAYSVLDCSKLNSIL